MGTLDTTLRCDHCGARLPDNQAVECPSCHSDLSEVGVSSELIEWRTIRRRGRTRFIFRRFVLGWGGVMAGGSSLGYYLFDDANLPLPFYIFITIICTVGGYFLGVVYWRSAEREFAAAEQLRQNSPDH